MPEYMYSVIVVILLVIFFAWWTVKKRDDQWEGVLEKKKFKAADEDSSAYFHLTFRSNEGKKKKFSTYDQKYWESWNEGDRAIKNKGEFFPTKVN